MPQNSADLALEAVPSAVATARRWVSAACAELGRPDLIECASLGTSELVTNAILHGDPPLTLRMRGTVEHPRVEVFDSSQMAPILMAPDDEDDASQIIATHGRGLQLVSRVATAWGATIEEVGKVVWFEPALDVHDLATPGIIDHDPAQGWEAVVETVTIRFLGVDTTLLTSALIHYFNLRRELKLLALSHDSKYPIARDFSPFFATFERQMPPRTVADLFQQVKESNAPTFDIILPTAPRTANLFSTMRELFDLADGFCRAEQLLSLARTPGQRAIQEWVLIEFVRQLSGEEPRPWSNQMLLKYGQHPSDESGDWPDQA